MNSFLHTDSVQGCMAAWYWAINQGMHYASVVRHLNQVHGCELSSEVRWQIALDKDSFHPIAMSSLIWEDKSSQIASREKKQKLCLNPITLCRPWERSNVSNMHEIRQVLCHVTLLQLQLRFLVTTWKPRRGICYKQEMNHAACVIYKDSGIKACRWWHFDWEVSWWDTDYMGSSLDYLSSEVSIP